MEFYQKFGNILPNIGQFHYCLTMLRSYVKLVWNIDYSELVISIHFKSPKAQFVQQKVTDYRSSLDTFRISMAGKLREMVCPFVKYARDNEIARAVNSFYIWKNFCVKSEKYELVLILKRNMLQAFGSFRRH